MVRLSGSQALEIADEIFVAGKKKLSQVDSHTIHYGHIYDDKREGFLDEVMVSVLKAPKHLPAKTSSKSIVMVGWSLPIKFYNWFYAKGHA